MDHASPPWRHARERERDVAAHAGRGAEVLAFERDASGGIESVGLVLWSRDEGLEVTNIVPRRVSELGIRGYNAALEDFVARVAKPAAAATGYIVESSAAQQVLDDWLPAEAAGALRRFSAAANKATGSTHPMDRKRWFAFLISVHGAEAEFSTDLLVRWLTEVEGWSDDNAHDLAIEYEFGLALLDEYDRDQF
ncbi:hypothetical protein KXS07_31505 [Inquilinus limosus]